MRENIFKRLRSKLYIYRFELLLASLLCVFVLNVLFPKDIYGGEVQGFYLFFQVFAGINLFNYTKRVRRFVLIVSIIVILGRLFDMYVPVNVREYVSFIYICFFGWVTMELFRQIYHAEVIDRKVIFAAICGLLLIGYCGFFVFATVEFFVPGSFQGLSEGNLGLNELFYYSYITIMTIGYGDISPASWIAKNVTVLVALIGYIYSLVVIAFIVGRFSAKPKHGIKENDN